VSRQNQEILAVPEMSAKLRGDFHTGSNTNDDVGNDPRGEDIVTMDLTTGDSGITRVAQRKLKLRSAEGI